MASKDKSSEMRDQIIDAALALASENPWNRVALSDIAAKAEISLSELRRTFSSKQAILSGFIARVDAAVLEQIDEEIIDDPARERLFDILVSRFEYLQPHRAALKSITRALKCDPAALMDANCMAANSMRWMMEASGIDASGIRGRIRAQGLVMIMARTMETFFKDEDPGLARTMAALDKYLNQGEQMVRRADDFCRMAGGFRRVAKDIRKCRPRRRRDEDYLDEAPEGAGSGI